MTNSSILLAGLFSATIDIILMLLVAFILGYLLRYFIGQRKLNRLEDERNKLESKKLELERDLNSCHEESDKKVLQGIAEFKNSMKPANPDDLKKVEGIGPKIESLLNAAGIWKFSDLADTPAEEIKEVLDKAGPAFTTHVPTTWPQQAAMARDGEWEKLKKWQDELDGGK